MLRRNPKGGGVPTEYSARVQDGFAALHLTRQ